MPQVLVTQRIDNLDRRSYAVGMVVSFSDLDVIAWLKSRFVVDDNAVAVAAAVAAGAQQVVHVAGAASSANPLMTDINADSGLRVLAAESIVGRVESTSRGRRLLSKLLWGKMKSVDITADHTSQIQFTLECPSDQPIVTLFNPCGVDLVNVRATLTVQTASGLIDGAEANANFENCIQLTLGGAVTFNLSGTINGTASSAENPSVTVLDVVQDWKLVTKDRTDFPGRKHIYCLRVHIPLAGNTKRPAFDLPPSVNGWGVENMNSAPYGRIVRCRTQNVLAASLASQGNFTATAWDNNVFPFAIQYTPRQREGATVMVYGNSIDEGALSTVGNFGWAHEMQNMLSTTARPLEVMCLAASGTGSSLERHRSTWIDTFRPTAVLWPCWNHNDFLNGSVIVQADLDYNRFRNAPLLARASQSNIKLVPVSSTPVTYGTSLKTYGLTDAVRVANDALYKGLFADFIDVGTPLAGTTTNGQVNLKAEYLPVGDAAPGLHPNTLGAIAMATSAAPVVRRVIGWG